VFGFGTNHEEEDFISMRRQKPSSLHNSMLYREQNPHEVFLFPYKEELLPWTRRGFVKKNTEYAC
jgi:hypothetical protein